MRVTDRRLATLLAALLAVSASLTSHAEDLTVSLAIDRPRRGPATVDIEKPLRVVLTNDSDRVLRIPHPKSRDGYYCLSLKCQPLPTGRPVVTSKRRIDDPEYFDALAEEINPDQNFITIEPGQSSTLNVSLSGYAWEQLRWTNRPAPNSGITYSIAAQYRSAVEGTEERPAWTGTAASPPATVRFVSDRIRTPHDYLDNGFPDLALQMMKENPAWVQHMGRDQLTTLHLAATHGYATVTAWLLENGADVNATAYNGFTPLHVCSDPDVVRAILKHGPDLTIECRSQGQTPLQKAGAELNNARTEAERKRWKSIAQQFLAAGAEYDILTAIELNDLNRLKAVARDSAKATNRFESPLRRAAALGRVEMCRLLVERYHHDVDQFASGCGYPIIKAALPHPEVVQILIENGADLKRRITWQGGRTGLSVIGDEATALHHAANDGVPETIRLLLNAGVDLFATTEPAFGEKTSNQTALDVATIFGKADNAFALINHRQFKQADARRRQAILDRCLVTSVASRWPARDGDQAKLLRILLHSGANPNTTDADGHTAIQLAASGVHKTPPGDESDAHVLVRILRAHGAEIDLFTAVAVGDEPAVANILQQDPDVVDVRRPDGLPALHVAVTMNYPRIIRMLLAAGADVDIRSRSETTGIAGGTPLHCAAFWGRDELAGLLIKSGARVNARGDIGSTPLHSAARMSNAGMVNLLLDNGAIVDAKDDEGRTPLDWCKELDWKNADEVQKILERHRAKQAGSPSGN